MAIPYYVCQGIPWAFNMYLVDSGYEPFRFIHFNLQAFPKPIVGFNNVQKK